MLVYLVRPLVTSLANINRFSPLTPFSPFTPFPLFSPFGSFRLFSPVSRLKGLKAEEGVIRAKTIKRTKWGGG